MEFVDKHDKDAVVPAWSIQSTDEKKHANMKISTVKVVVESAAVMKKVGVQKDSTTIEIPMFVNSKVLKKGTQLYYHCSADDKDEDEEPTNKRKFDLV